MNVQKTILIRRVLTFAFLTLISLGLQAENRQALLIANSAYKHFGSLETPVPEAQDLAATLERLGFQVTLLRNASREEMLVALDKFGSALKGKGGIAFFHYGGHGVQVGGKNYLIPADADIPDELRARTRAVDMDEVMNTLIDSGADTSIVILDACRNDPLPASSGRSATRGLTVVGNQPKNSIIVYAAKADSVAQDGLFTPALTRELAKPGLSLLDVLTEVRNEVYKKSNGAQTPGDYNQLFTPVYLAGPGTAPGPAVTVVPAPSVVTPTITVSRSYGSLSITLASAGTLYLDGKAMGDLPAGAKAKLESVEVGDRSLEVRYADGQVEKQSATVDEGGATSVSFTYRKALPPAVVPASSADMVLVNGGTFTMGSPQSEQGRFDNEVQHQVSVSSFHMGKFDVTQDLYQSVMGSNPSQFTGDGNRPVERVSWYDAVEFCNKLSERDGLAKVYTINGTDVTADWSANGYRLPTEAEWEYAARGGQQGVSEYHVYAGSDNLDQVGWYKDNSGGTTHPVGQKAPNALGLYDMTGNVWQWCWDWYAANAGGGQNDPRGASSGGGRVLRGESWGNDARYGRVADRGNDTPAYRGGDLGFRLVRP